MRVGVLALQGDFHTHCVSLAVLGIEPVEIRYAEEMAGIAGLVLPGGESTTMLRLMHGNGMADALRERISGGLPVLATCAGVILLAREVRQPCQESLGLLDVVVERNAYGRQLQSSVAPLQVAATDLLGTDTLEGVFIRAPRVAAVGKGVEVLARRGADPVLLRDGHVLAATFHPELSESSPVIDLFVRFCGGER